MHLRVHSDESPRRHDLPQRSAKFDWSRKIGGCGGIGPVGIGLAVMGLSHSCHIEGIAEGGVVLTQSY